MIIITLSQDYDRIDSILSHPVISKVTGYTGTPDKTFQYYLAQDEDQLMGVFSTRQINSELLECHIQILPEFWGNGLAAKMGGLFTDHLRKTTDYSKAMTFVPSDCEQVIRYLNKLGSTVCGMIKDGCFYNNKKTDLIMFEYNLRVS